MPAIMVILSEDFYSFLGLLGWITLILLPGTWVTFGLSLSGFSFWARLLIGIIFTPLVVCMQFYVLRILGASFELTALLLVFINLPVLYLIYKRREEISFPDFQTLLGAAVVLLIPLALLAPQLLDSNVRVFTGHSWMQTDIVYMLANGHLQLEEPELAGVNLVYPWAFHPLQAVLSYLLGSAPASNYIWTNLVWLVCMYGFSAFTVAELGGNRFSQVTSFLWVCFGLNFVGYVFFSMLPAAIAGTFWEHGTYNYAWIGGDYRITPWMLKFFFFEQSIFGLCIFSAIIYLLLKERDSGLTFDTLILLGFLLCSIGLVYPVFYAPAVIIVCSVALTFFLDRSKPEKPDYLRLCYALGIVLFITSAVTYSYLKFLTIDRTTESMILPSISYHFVKNTLIKTASSVIVLSLLLAGTGFAFRRCWKTNRNSTLILLISGLGSVLMYIFLEIPKPSAEYKFLLIAAICFAPFSVLALQPYLERLKDKALPTFALIAFLLIAPAAHKVYTDFPWTPPWANLSVDASNFYLRLDKNESLSALCDVIKQKTPSNSILVVEKSEIHFPTLTLRSLYAPPLQDKPHPGIFIMSSLLLGTQKGYGKKIIDERRTIVKELFNLTDDNKRAESLGKILQLKRPIAIILEKPRHFALQKWLTSSSGNKLLFDDDNVMLWLIEPDNLP